MSKRRCLNCQKIYVKNKKYSKNQWNKSKFCSMKCLTNFIGLKRIGKYIGENSPSWKGGLSKCIICKKKLGTRKAKYCNKHKGILMTGKANWKWRGGKKTEKQRKCFSQIRREINKKGNGGSHTLQDWKGLKEKYNFRCACCWKQEPEIKLTEDHIIPIKKGGSDNIENIQPLCQSCNSKKHTQIIKYNYFCDCGKPYNEHTCYWSPCSGCKDGHSSFHKTIIESQEWTKWKSVSASANRRSGMNWDFSENEELGILSQKHWKAFIQFIKKQKI